MVRIRKPKIIKGDTFQFIEPIKKESKGSNKYHKIKNDK